MAGTKVNLLVVDDDASLRMSLSHIFAAFGHRVRCAADGFSALSELRLEVPDIILSDLNMPGMSGFELLSVVRRRFPSIKVIAMSSAFAIDDIPLGVAAHAFYQKGSNLGHLLEMVEGMTTPEAPQLAQTGQHSGAYLGGADWTQLSRREQILCSLARSASGPFHSCRWRPRSRCTKRTAFTATARSITRSSSPCIPPLRRGRSHKQAIRTVWMPPERQAQDSCS